MALLPFNFILEKSQINENQKIRDRRRRGIRSFNWHFNRTNEDRIHKIKRAKSIVQDLENYGPAGLIHIPVLNSIIRKPIKIRNANGSLNRIIGKIKSGRPIDIEFHTVNTEIGHWTLRYGKDPVNANISLNNCLFSVIGSQTGHDPFELRRRTILRLKNNLQELTNRIDEILQLEGNNGMALMIGGARYCGTCPNCAKMILDASHNQPCYACGGKLGHPRGHAPSSSGSNGVEAYSHSGWKTAFLSRADQDFVTHLALKSQQAQIAMEQLNRGISTITIRMSPRDLYAHDLPKAREYTKGVPTSGERDIKEVVLVLRHHLGQEKNPLADVFVHTCYPRI